MVHSDDSRLEVFGLFQPTQWLRLLRRMLADVMLLLLLLLQRIFYPNERLGFNG